MEDADAVLYEKLSAELANNTTKQSVLFSVKSVASMRTNLALLRNLLLDDKQKILYVCLGRLHLYLERLLTLHNVGQDNLIFVDTISRLSGINLKTTNNVKFTDCPFDLNLLYNTVSKAFKNRIELHDIDFSGINSIILDNLSELEIYNSTESIIKFTTHMIFIAKQLKKEIVVIILDKDIHFDLYNSIKDICDIEIEAKTEWFA